MTTIQGLNSKQKLRKAEDWTRSFLHLVKSMNSDLNVLFSGLKDDEIEESEALTAQEEKSESEETSVQVAATYFVKKTQKLISLLCEPLNATARLPLKLVLQMTTRCLRVSHSDIKSVPSMTELASLLPTLHQAALDVSSQLILCCKSLLLPWSGSIIDYGLKTLTSSRQMEDKDRSLTRGCAYRLLSLCVKTFGWGRHLDRQAKILLQELVSDIKIEHGAKETAPAYNNNNNNKDEVPRLRKGKKKKKNKAESYSDLPVVSGDDKNDEETKIWSVEATSEALEMTRLVLERTDFSTVENLVRCIVETTVVLQREGPPHRSPYLTDVCRKGLYSSLLGCALMRLGGRNLCKKDAILHFQTSNSALTLLKCALHTDNSVEVHNVCRQALVTVSSSGNLTRPVMRRVIPDETGDSRDLMEVEKEMERLNEENERLKSALVDSELKAQRDARLMSDLRRQLESLEKEGASEHLQSSTSATAGGEVPHLDSDKEDESSDGDESKDDEAGETGKEMRTVGKAPVSLDHRGKVSPVQISMEPKQEKPTSKRSKISPRTPYFPRKPGGLDLVGLKLKKDQVPEFNSSTKNKKRPNRIEESQQLKKQKVETESTEEKSEPGPSVKPPDESNMSENLSSQDQSDDLEAMLADFVDAEPDLP